MERPASFDTTEIGGERLKKKKKNEKERATQTLGST